MQSKNHQFLDLSDQVVRRYVRTDIAPLTGYRLNPTNPTMQMDWLLATPEENYDFIPYTSEKTTQVVQKTFSYHDEVLELYSDKEVRVFEQLNRKLLQEGKLKEYTEVAPELDTVNTLTDIQVIRLASIKQLPALKKELLRITSPQTLERIRATAEALDRPTSIVNAVKSRMQEIKDDTNSG